MGIISIEKLDTENFSRFGSVIQKKNASELRSINQGTTKRYHNICILCQVSAKKQLISMEIEKTF